jgi:hypothetical protein
MMNDYYWIFNLRVFTVFRLLGQRGHIKHMTYIDATRPAETLLRLGVKLKLFSFGIDHIQQRTGPAGPVFHLSTVRDDRGRVITFDINHHVLALRQQVLHYLKERLKGLYFMDAYRSKSILTAYLGIQAVRDINGIVFFADYARWKYYDPTAAGQVRNILVIPRTEWSHILVKDFQENLGHRVIVERRYKRRIKPAYGLFKHLVRPFLGVLAGRPDKMADTPGNSRIMVSYAMGTAADRRNDISFFHAVNGGMKPSQLLFYFRFKNLYPSDTELEWFKEHNIPCYTSSMVAEEIPSLPPWQPSPDFKVHLHEFYRVYLKTAVQCLFRRKHWFWLLDMLWEMGWNVAYWKDFFIANQVRVIVHSVPGVWNFVPNLAIAETGGIAANLERSILFDYCTYFHNSPNHINFVTGSYSLTQIPEPSFSRHTLQVGGINVGNHPPIPWIEEKRRQGKVVIAVFDELPNDWYFGDAVRQFYEALMELVTADKENRFALVIKTKKPEVLERLKSVNEEVKRLTEAGVCLFPDWKVSPANAAALSDLVVCVPSTAAFESVLTGTPTIVFSPMKSGSSLFYSNNGLNRRVFEDSVSMVEAIRRFAEDTDSLVGDCGDLAERIDPYGDGKGAERLGHYLLQCLEGFDNGKNRDDIIHEANLAFTRRYGEDKQTGEDHYG